MIIHGFCEGGQLTQPLKTELFDKLFKSFDDDTEGIVTIEDVKTGLMLYSAVVYCNNIKLHNFMYSEKHFVIVIHYFSLQLHLS